jgi:hypothetical protein
LRAAGNDTFLAETTLSALEANLKRFQQHKDWVVRRADTQKETATAAQNVITAT